MNLYLVGMSHQTAPITMREAVAVSPKQLPSALQRLRAYPEIREVAILSTCHRTEVYAVCAQEAPVLACFAALCTIPMDDLRPFLYFMRDRAVAQHLFRVTAGLESLAIGEDQIQGQVAAALAGAQHGGSVDTVLNGLFQQALAAGKRVRSETVIGRGFTGISGIAVDLITALRPDVSTCSVLLLGAGEMAETIARCLGEHGARMVFVANRTHARAVELAAQFNGKAIYFHEIASLLTQCDVVISSTAAPHYVLDLATVARAREEAHQRSSLFIDLALPRDIDPRVGALPGVQLYNLDDLRSVAHDALRQREQELSRAEAILADELLRWSIRQAGMEIAPVISALQAHVEHICRQALLTETAQLTSAHSGKLESLAHALAKRLLHTPTVKLKALCAEREDTLPALLLGELFDLPDHPKGEA